MIAFTALAVQVILWQDQDISVSIVSETEEGNKEVTISVRNTAGSTLLFYENDDITGKIEFLSDDGWVEYCDVIYTAGNACAISPVYGGTFASLEPGEDWKVSVPEDKVAAMKSGTYRIKMTYVTENQYNKYLDSQFENRGESTDESIDESFADMDISEAISNEDFIGDLIANLGFGDDEAEEITESFIAESVSEVYIKDFDYVAPEEFVSTISFDSVTIGEPVYEPSNYDISCIKETSVSELN